MYTHLFIKYSEQFFQHISLPLVCITLHVTFYSSWTKLTEATRNIYNAFKNLIYILLPPPIWRFTYFTQLFFVNHLQHSHYSLDLSPCTCKLGSLCFIASTVLKRNKINQINKWQRSKKRNDCPDSSNLEAANNMCCSYKLHVQQWIMEHFKHALLTPCIKWDLER